MEYKGIDQKICNTLIVEKSKFITYLFPCFSEEEFKEILQDINEKYHDATHICYAYILYKDQSLVYKANDDGEPSSTAGLPMLNVLKKNDLINVSCIAIRYFGGIKLGAGGLTRTYSSCASEALKKINIVTYCSSYFYEIDLPYDKIKDIEKICENNRFEIKEKSFDLSVKYKVLTKDKEKFEKIFSSMAYLNINYRYISFTYTIK